MKRIEKLRKRTNNFLYNHLWLKFIVDYGFALLATLFSAAIFAFCINTFLQPSVLGGECANMQSLVSGGSSGAAQVINLIFELNGIRIPNNPSLLFSIFWSKVVADAKTSFLRKPDLTGIVSTNNDSSSPLSNVSSNQILSDSSTCPRNIWGNF